ncbi:hypothetical protein DXA38_03435 [[Clostridium] innocuum]|uniref:Uncharacterized protein n=1 Tax=Clostridium innocuum TaxID=1522 RepID=A0A3E2W338_CLOIN|nr:hypothetical protein DXA38_03435 [[Clostridium] innocuum]
MTAICAVTNSKKFHIAIKDISYTVFEMEKEVKSSEVISYTKPIAAIELGYFHVCIVTDR